MPAAPIIATVRPVGGTQVSRWEGFMQVGGSKQVGGVQAGGRGSSR